MVAAGVYLVARTFDIFHASPDALMVVAYVGGFTAIFAASIGIAQNDIKRILAYSTVSQLGYMMMALGIGVSITSGMFHLFTHAFFKALLFLGAGSVIHAVHTQNINEMGGLSRKMKITTWTFAIGTLALAGIFPFAGFWSKDMILTEAYEHNQLLFWIGVIAAFFTAFYMSRLFFLVFMGSSRAKAHTSEDHDDHGHGHDHAHEPHESPATMTTPLIVLAVLAVVAGFVNTPFNEWLGHWLTGQEHEEAANWTVIILSTLAGLLGIGLGYLIYLKRTIPRDIVSSKMPWLYTLLNRKYFIDEIYEAIVVKPLRGLGFILELIDIYIIDGIVRLVAFTVVSLGRLGSRLQNGQLQSYGIIMLLGMLILALAIAGRRFIHAG
ncbi:NADH-quinone oxidoreductase subunit 12 [compost metagenome]